MPANESRAAGLGNGSRLLITHCHLDEPLGKLAFVARFPWLIDMNSPSSVIGDAINPRSMVTSAEFPLLQQL